MNLFSLFKHKAFQDINLGGINTVIFFSIIINLLMLIIPLYTLQVYDRVLTSHSVDTLVALSVGILFTVAVIATVEAIKSYVLTRIGNNMHINSSTKVLNASITKSVQNASPQVEPIRDLNKIINFVSNNSVGLVSLLDLPWIPIFVVIIYFIHPILGVVTAIFMVLLLITTILANKMTHNHYEKAFVSASKAEKRLMEVMNNAGIVCAMGMRKNMLQYWEEYKLDNVANSSNANDLSSIFKSIAKFIRLVQSIGITGVGAYLVLNNELTVGAMIAANILSGRGSAPFEAFIASYKSLLETKDAITRLDNVLTSYDMHQQSTKLPTPKGKISVENVEYSINGQNKPILSNINLQIKEGEIVGILGASASGKSTLAKILVGILKPTKGHSRLDDADVYSWSVNGEVGQYIGYLPQEVMLFDGTIRDNIARFSQCSDEEVTNTCKMAEVHDMILRLPNGYDTVVGNDGVLLSGGQKQRIALARALFRTPKFLVLDEPNSNLDTEGEIALLNTLKKLKDLGITTILITHKLVLTANTDKLIVIANGEIKIFDERQKVLNLISNQKNS